MGVSFSCRTSSPLTFGYPGTLLHYRLFSWIIGKPGARIKRLSNLGHWKYGLRYEDLFIGTETVEKAMARVPLREQELRNRRVKRACVLFAAKQELPKDEWTKPEDEIEYLSPYICEILEEDHDRNTWMM